MVHNWTDANTAILYARSAEASFVFTLKFDAKGNEKIVNAHPMSKKEVEEFNQ